MTHSARPSDTRKKDSLTRLLLWPGSSGAGSNPYVGYFAEALKTQGFSVSSFSLSNWRFGLAQFDALLVHWPEAAAQGNTKFEQKLSYSLFLLTVKIFRLRGKSVIWVYHNEQPHQKKHISYEKMARHVDGLLSPSEIGLKLAITRHPCLANVPTSVSRIGRYSNLNHNSKDNQPLSVSDRKHILISFGYIRPYKGLENLINAVNQLERDDTTLIICGHSFDDTYVDQLRKLVVDSDKVKFMVGFLSTEMLDSYLKQATAAVFSFSNILHSSSVVAARSAGLPVLVPAVGSLIEYSEIDPGIYLSNDPLTSECTAAFIDHYDQTPAELPDEHFSWEKIGAQTAILIRQVIQRNSL